MEDPCVAAALQLQLEDLENFTQTRKGKGVEGRVNDQDLALELYQAELESLEQFLQDLKLAQSIVRAVETDAEIIRIVREDEDRATRDRSIACTLGGLEPLAKPKQEDSKVLDPDVEILVQLTHINGSISVGKEDEEDRPAIPSSSQAVGNKFMFSHSGMSRQECIVCREKKFDFDTMRAPCGDCYCRDCVASLFLAALTDESLFPPRYCGQNIGVELAKDFLEPAIQSEFAEKSVEYSTPNRTYCSRPDCSRFLPSSVIAADVGTCTCGVRTCTVCKGGAHEGDCPDDPAIREVLALAAANDWRRCSDCKRMVELTFGCNHMT